MKSNLGKILRLNDDGSAALDNPFYEQGGVTAEIWSLGHRNPLGMAFDRKDSYGWLRWGLKVVMSLILLPKAKTMVIRLFQMEIIIQVSLFQIITRAQSLKRQKLTGPCNLTVELNYLSRTTISRMAK